MSNVGKLVLILPFILTLGCSEQDPEITRISSLSISPKFQTEGPYIVTEENFSKNYEISGECSKEVTDIQIKTPESSWMSLSEVLSDSDADCNDQTFKINFKLDQLGFTTGVYEKRSLSLKNIAINEESEALTLIINYQEPAPENLSSQPTIDSIEYITNTELKVNWSFASENQNSELIINIENGQTPTNGCSSGKIVAPVTNIPSGSTNLVSGSTGLSSFDLSTNDVVISACGKDINNNVSLATTTVFYKNPSPPTSVISAKDTEIELSNIAADGANLFELTFAKSPTTAPDCPTLGSAITEKILTPLSPNTDYNIRLCAYNQNTDPQLSSTEYAITTMKSKPDPPTAITLSRESGSLNLMVSNLDPAKTYFMDVAEQFSNLATDYNNSLYKNITAQTSYSFPALKNKKYFVRVWVYDSAAYPSVSESVDKSELSYIELLKRDSNSQRWGYYIVNNKPNPHEMTNFQNECTSTAIDALAKPTDCVNAGLLWYLPVPGSTACSDFNVEVVNSFTTEKVPFLWKCIQGPQSANFQIIGTKNSFELKKQLSSTSFNPFKINLKNNSNSIVSESLTNQTLWLNSVQAFNTTTLTSLTSSSDNNIIYLENGHTGPVSLDGVSNATVVYAGDNFNSTTGTNLTVSSSKNIFIEMNASNSSTLPLKVLDSKNITLSASNMFSSNQAVQMNTSNFIKIQNSKFMNFQNSSALQMTDSNNIYLTNSKISNSASGIEYSTFLTIPININISQTFLAGLGNASSAINILNTYTDGTLNTNLNHITSKDNAFDSFYINSKKQNLVFNQVLAVGTDTDSDTNPDGYGLFASFEDPTSTFYFSQLGFKDFIQNIDLKNNNTPESIADPIYKFQNIYVSSEIKTPCNLSNTAGDYGQCTESLLTNKIDNFNFGQLETSSTLKSDLTPSDWLNSDQFEYWLNGLVTCQSSATCNLYSTILDRTSSNIIDSSKDFTSKFTNNIYSPSSGEFVSPANCNDVLKIEAEYVNPNTGTKKYIANAAEINTDMIGNNNGLCEESEVCVMSPNLGAYQGHFDPTHTEYKKCEYTPTTVSAEVLAYPMNGQ